MKALVDSECSLGQSSCWVRRIVTKVALSPWFIFPCFPLPVLASTLQAVKTCLQVNWIMVHKDTWHGRDFTKVFEICCLLLFLFVYIYIPSDFLWSHIPPSCLLPFSLLTCSLAPFHHYKVFPIPFSDWSITWTKAWIKNKIKGFIIFPSILLPPHLPKRVGKKNK